MNIRRVPKLIRFITLALVLLLGFGFALSSLPAAEAQCSPRTDWPVYTVVRGDTLARIAARYGTTTSVLVSANCITNACRIYTGQRLYVPSQNSPRIGATFQAFERGFMIWRADTGEIVVYYTSSSSTTSGLVTSYPSSSYAGLSDNPTTDPTPAGRVRPAFGFGKVWGNYATVRTTIGWATASEQGYSITFRSLMGTTGTQTCFNLPDGRYAQASTQTWQYVTSCG